MVGGDAVGRRQHPFVAVAAVVTWALGWPGLALAVPVTVVAWSRPDVFGLPRP